MADIVIRNMEMPKEGGIEIMILAEGIAIETGHTVRIDGKDYYTATLGDKPATEAIGITDHGDLIDREKTIMKTISLAEMMEERINDEAAAPYMMMSLYLKNKDDFPTVIPASGEE